MTRLTEVSVCKLLTTKLKQAELAGEPASWPIPIDKEVLAFIARGRSEIYVYDALGALQENSLSRPRRRTH
jgi:hypothetical protein